MYVAYDSNFRHVGFCFCRLTTLLYTHWAISMLIKGNGLS
jgi:hypothetical protein